jgi:hypothetical protein
MRKNLIFGEDTKRQILHAQMSKKQTTLATQVTRLLSTSPVIKIKTKVHNLTFDLAQVFVWVQFIGRTLCSTLVWFRHEFIV